MTTVAQPEPQPITPAATVDIPAPRTATLDAAINPDLGPVIVPAAELDLRPAVTQPPSARSLRATKDVNGIYHSNAGRGLMWVTIWVVFAAWVVLVGGIVVAGLT
jgi:hypothetical protein